MSQAWLLVLAASMQKNKKQKKPKQKTRALVLAVDEDSMVVPEPILFLELLVR